MPNLMRILNQSFYTSWLADHTRMMRGLRDLRRTRGVCVLWKTNNVGGVSTGSHPAKFGGVVDHLNRAAVRLAARMEVPVIDVAELVTRNSRTPKDIYHGYDNRTLAQAIFRRVINVCGAAHVPAEIVSYIGYAPGH